ncbi:hypothetical protein CBM2623_A10110 [Cupriavidus taiwanensis]|nr:hypothetical protein CBM2623_A10110 [Cupriavidus taiwanensis]
MRFQGPAEAFLMKFGQEVLFRDLLTFHGLSIGCGVACRFSKQLGSLGLDFNLVPGTQHEGSKEIAKLATYSDEGPPG